MSNGVRNTSMPVPSIEIHVLPKLHLAAGRAGRNLEQMYVTGISRRPPYNILRQVNL